MKKITEEECQGAYERTLAGPWGFDHARIALFTVGGKREKVKIAAEDSQLDRGACYLLYGAWKNHPKYGRQFAATSFAKTEPVEREGVIAYLQLCPGIGPVIACRMWVKFGDQCIAKMKSDPEEVGRAVGISAQKAHDIAQDLIARGNEERLRIGLLTLLKGRGLPKTIIDRLIRLWGAKAESIIRINPYRLMMFKGVGFAVTDAMYIEMGKNPAALKRQALATWYEMSRASDGDTWFSEVTCEEFMKKHITRGVEFKRAMELGVRGKLFATLSTKRMKWYTIKARADAEDLIAEKIAGLLENASEWPKVTTEDGCTAHQAREINLATASTVGIITGGAGTGKCQNLSAKVVTPQGLREIGSLRPGDEIMNSEGGISKITGFFPRGKREVYRVEFSDGSATKCCGEHLWATRRRDRGSHGKKRKETPFQISSLAEIAESMLDSYGESNHSIPITKSLRFPKCDLLLDPYLMGLLLGDGGFSQGSIRFTKPDKEIIETVTKLVPFPCKLYRRKKDDYAITVGYATGRGRKKNPLLTILGTLKLSGKLTHEKHVPESFLFAALEDRIALLQGLMDTDGYANGCNAEFSTSSSVMSDQFQFLVESLGGTARKISRIPTYSYKGEKKKGRTSYRFYICLPPEIIPFRLTRKRKRFVPHTKYLPRRIIRSIEAAGTEETCCISTDAPGGLYLTDHCIVTHNTTSVAKLVARIVEKFSSNEISVISPTGKAAVRITEIMRKADVHLTATTIHAALKARPVVEGGAEGWRFTHDERNLLHARFFVIEESSMLDVQLLANFLRAVRKDAHILFVGDTHQLPPVGHGSPMRDLIRAKVARGELTEIIRHQGMIVEICRSIREERAHILPSRLLPNDLVNIKLVTRRTPLTARGAIIEILKKIAQSGKFDPVWECQVICAVNKKGDLAREILNEILQTEFNANNKVAGRFWENDKVICTRNGMFPEAAPQQVDSDAPIIPDKENKIYVANGDIGRVLSVDHGVVVVRFDFPERIAGFPFGEEGTDRLQLAYAISCHKMQGCQAPLVIVAIDDGRAAGWVVNRAWMYTAISRAEKICILVGKEETYWEYLKKTGDQKRKTFLADKVLEKMEEDGSRIDHSGDH